MTWQTSVNTSLLTTYLNRKFIPTLEEELQFMKFCMKGNLPGGMGNVLRFNLFPNPAIQTTKLDEGTTSGNELSAGLTTTGYDATLAEYGEFLKTTRLQEYTQVPNSRSELANRMSFGAARSLDRMINVGPTSGPADNSGANSTTLDWYCGTAQAGGSGTAATPTAGSAAAIIGASELLRASSVNGFTGVSGHPNGALAAIVSTRFERDMVQEATTGRITWGQAVTNVPGALGQTKWVKGYMGEVYGTACYRSQNLTQSTITSTSDNNYILGEGGLGCVSIIDADPQIHVNVPSSQDIGNPYRNLGTIAWHTYWANRLLDGTRVIRVYSLNT